MNNFFIGDAAMTTKGIKPDDILADTKIMVGKGSIDAFVKNSSDLLEDSNSTELQKAAALAMIKELAPAIIAAGLHKHATFKNKIIEDILSTI